MNSSLGGGVLLVEVKKGILTASTWDANTEKIFDNAQNKVYFHKDISPQITFDATKVLVDLTAQGNSIVKASDTSFQMLGTVKINIGLASLPTGITLGHLVDGLGTEKDGTGRDISLEIFDSSDTLKFSIKAEVAPVTKPVKTVPEADDAQPKQVSSYYLLSRCQGSDQNPNSS